MLILRCCVPLPIRFQSISLSVKVLNAVEFGKYLKFLLQASRERSSSSRDVFTVLMEGAVKLVFPDKIDIIWKNNKQKLHNDLIDSLQQKGLSKGKPFVTQLVHILWQLDGHHEKLAAQSCPIPDLFSTYQNYSSWVSSTL